MADDKTAEPGSLPFTPPGPTAMGWDVYRWPEFWAFAERLGIPLELLTIDVTIHIPVEGPVVVTHHYQGADTTQRTP